MNLSLDFNSKEKLFRGLADRSRLSILHTLFEGPKTASQIAAATRLSLTDASTHLERLLDCGCVRPQNEGLSVIYALSPPRLLQLEGIVDEMLIGSLKKPLV